MRMIFTSDKFSYIHPRLSPRRSNEYSQKELDEAVANTDKVVMDKHLFGSASNSIGKSLPTSQLGSLIVFPTMESVMTDVSEEQKESFRNFIWEEFANCERELSEEYSEPSDPTKFYGMSDGGKYFSAHFENPTSRGKEIFDHTSLSICIAGCKPGTANYLFEAFLLECYKDSDRHDRKIDKSGNGIKFGFSSMKSFLVFDFGNRQFHQMGIRENELFR